MWPTAGLKRENHLSREEGVKDWPLGTRRKRNEGHLGGRGRSERRESKVSGVQRPANGVWTRRAEGAEDSSRLPHGAAEAKCAHRGMTGTCWKGAMNGHET